MEFRWITLTLLVGLDGGIYTDDMFMSRREGRVRFHASSFSMLVALDHNAALTTPVRGSQSERSIV